MKLYDCFEKKIRVDGSEGRESYVTLKDEHRKGWLYDAIYEAHDGILPNDWIYEECRAACGAIDDGEFGADRAKQESGHDDEDILFSYADARVDVYTKDVFRWASDFATSNLFAAAEERAKECGEPEDTTKRLMQIQFFAIEQIARTMLDAWREGKAAIDGADVKGAS